MEMKRIVSVILTLALFMGALSAFSVSASAVEIEPYLNNTSSTTTRFSISSTGKAQISMVCVGDSNFTRVNIVSYIEKKTLGLFWTRVDIGTNNNEWKDSSNKNPYSQTRSTTLDSKGTYRAVVTYTVEGTGGSDDVIKDVVEDKYE